LGESGETQKGRDQYGDQRLRGHPLHRAPPHAAILSEEAGPDKVARRVRFPANSGIISACSRRRITRELLVFAACLAALLVHLALERLRLDRALRKVPRRIAVTGSRGKSGTARLIAAGLRASGARVLAKTTGSKAALILPDGSERDIPRPGPASIREQARLVSLAARLGADTLVAEMMSIGPECLAAESRGLLRPQILVLTNVRLDHLEDMGRTRKDIAASLSEAFPVGGEVFFPAEESDPVFETSAARLGAELVPVPPPSADTRAEASSGPLSWEFEPNVRLAGAVLERLGLDRDKLLEAMAAARPDFGSLRVVRARFGSPPRPAVCVSAFAANDPGSSAEALAKARDRVDPGPSGPVGLLNLREDRGDRTMQWLSAAREGFFRDFERVLVLGAPAKAFVRKLGRYAGPEAARFEPAPQAGPERLMDSILARAGREPVVIGLGNVAGSGEEILRYWESQGADHGP
jgi:poly-gamma-glutamate synthase PgsB/CapB